MPKVSVIVPVYKTEKYVSKCIESILAQSFSDFELILVDDGSPDKSGTVCDEYAKRDTRIKVIHKANSGVSAARNTGLDVASGEWVTFVDSDDWVENDYIQEMVTSVKSDTDFIFCNRENINNVRIISRKELPATKILSCLWINHYLELSAPVSKLFKMSILKQNKIKFPHGIHMGEDAIFLLDYLSSCTGHIILLPNNSYQVLKLADSLSTKFYSYQDEYYCFKAWKKSYERLINKQDENNNSYYNMWNNRLGDTFLRVFLTIIYNHTNSFWRSCKSVFNYIDTDDLNDFIQYYRPVTYKRYLLKFLISHKIYAGLFLISNLIYLEQNVICLKNNE